MSLTLVWLLLTLVLFPVFYVPIKLCHMHRERQRHAPFVDLSAAALEADKLGRLRRATDTALTNLKD